MEYSEKWKTLSKDLRDERGKCDSCGSEYSLTVHHGYYRVADYHDYTDSTLWVLCWSCHSKHQRELHEILTLIGTVRPKDYRKILDDHLLLKDFPANHVDATEEYERTKNELEEYFPSCFDRYQVQISSNSDLGESVAPRLAKDIEKRFPKIITEVDCNEKDPDCLFQVTGPRPEIVATLEHLICQIRESSNY